jgi:hypothetical protein
MIRRIGVLTCERSNSTTNRPDDLETGRVSNSQRGFVESESTVPVPLHARHCAFPFGLGIAPMPRQARYLPVPRQRGHYADSWQAGHG